MEGRRLLSTDFVLRCCSEQGAPSEFALHDRLSLTPENVRLRQGPILSSPDTHVQKVGSTRLLLVSAEMPLSDHLSLIKTVSPCYHDIP